MKIRIKATGFKLTDGIKALAEEKILAPLEKRLGRELGDDHIVDVELARETKHHVEGLIWRCEANIAIPHVNRTIYAMALSQSLEGAIDETKDEIEREAMDYKNKRSAKFLRLARRMKERVHITRLAQSASDLYKWVRRR